MRTTTESRNDLLQAERAKLARGPLTHDEQVEFDCERAWAMYKAEQARLPLPATPELPFGKAG